MLFVLDYLVVLF